MGRRVKRDHQVTIEAVEPATKTEADVIELRAPEPVPLAPLEVRWCIPRAIGIAYSHAALVGARVSICGGFEVEGAIYPPPEEVPRCPQCVDDLKGLRAGRGEEVPDANG